MTTRTTTRRAMLAGTAAAMVPAVAGAACLAPDPIFAVIAEHDAAYHLEVATYERESALEEELPQDRMATCINIYIDPDEIDPDDDPRWIELARDIPVVFRRYNAAQWALAETMPTTAAGLKALLSHLNKHQARECVRHKRPAQYMAWPAQRCTSEGDSDSGEWLPRLFANLSRAAELVRS